MTFASGGYIIRIRPRAIGIFVVPRDREPISRGKEGNRYPIPTPAAIARKIQSVRRTSGKTN